MIYTITSRHTEIGETEKTFIKGPFHVKVPGRDKENHPLLGFSSTKLGEVFMRVRKFSEAEYCIVPMDDLLNEDNRHQSVLVYESEKQILDVLDDPEEYDYESLIQDNAL